MSKLISTCLPNAPRAVLQVSRKVEYALRAAVYLAAVDVGSVVAFREIAEVENVPKDFLAKILRKLVSRGVVRSVRGANGGYALARPASEITFLEVIEAAEGPIALNNCTTHGDGCVQVGACSMASVWQRGEAAMLDVFRQTKLSDLVESPSRLIRA